MDLHFEIIIKSIWVLLITLYRFNECLSEYKLITIINENAIKKENKYEILCIKALKEDIIRFIIAHDEDS